VCESSEFIFQYDQKYKQNQIKTKSRCPKNWFGDACVLIVIKFFGFVNVDEITCHCQAQYFEPEYSEKDGKSIKPEIIKAAGGDDERG
jgi:hypothetical protein